ncbi:MAG TPA: hypothetical protein VGC15_13155 [Acetobacteraceae bacterium]
MDRIGEALADPPARDSATNIGRKRQEGIYIAGFAGRWQPVPASPEQLASAALRKFSRDAAAYFAAGVGRHRHF